MNPDPIYSQTGTVAEFARSLAQRRPDEITHVFDGTPCRIGELLAESERLAGALHARGLRTGDVVAFQLPNWRETVTIDLACAALGLVVAPIIPIYRDAEIGFMLSDCRAKAFFIPDRYRGFDYAAMMQRLKSSLPDLRLLSCVRPSVPYEDAYQALVDRHAPLTEYPKVPAEAVKIILYTSGTTGHPKAVLHSHITLALVMRRVFASWGQGPGDTMLMASPVTHVTGFAAALELPLLCGIRSVIMEKWDAATGLDLIEREGATVSIGATPFLQELVAEAQRQGRGLPSLRHYVCGGAAVPPLLIRQANEVLAKCRAFRVFGSSEAPMVTVGFWGDEQLDLAAETDGEIFGYDVKLVDAEGAAVPNGTEGEICVRGPSLFLGYANPEQTRESFDAEGYFLTGDLGVLNESKALTITGRKKDLINRGGEKISAKEIEDVLHRNPAVAEAAVVSMPHERLGETACAYIVSAPGVAADAASLAAHVLASGVAKQKIPERFVFADVLPRTPSGKIKKDTLRADIRSRIARGE
jgi:acyl-CoA synthetase (AMP-forming)/AMP-acid ligase II